MNQPIPAIPDWLAELLVPVYRKLRSQEDTLLEAQRQVTAAEAALAIARPQFDALLALAAEQGFTREDVEAVCKVRTATTEGMTLSQAALIATVGELCQEAGGVLHVDQIMAGLVARKVTVSGKNPRANLAAYISRSPKFQHVGPSTYRWVG